MRALTIAAMALLLLSTAALCADRSPVIPSWVRPGLVVTYDSVSAFVNPYGQFKDSVRIIMTTRVISVSQGKVSASTVVQNVGTPITGKHEWTCDAAGNCKTDATRLSGKFWVDPDHPTDSAKGPNGEPFSVVGKAPYSYGGRTWNAVMLTYKNPETGFQQNVTFEAKTGLVLEDSETSPAEQVHAYFRSMTEPNP